jgi:hypothetical protein
MSIAQFSATLDKWARFAIRSHDDRNFHARDMAYSIIGLLRGACATKWGEFALVDYYLAHEA